MGLDIYVRWGGEWSNDEGKMVDNFREQSWEEWEDQMTGMVSAPQAGYLRESWGSLGWVRELTQKFGGPFPYAFFPDWNGYNGEELDLTDFATLDRVLDFRDKVIRPWCREHRYLPRDEDHTDEEREEYRSYMSRLYDVWGFLNFVDLNRDQPLLRIQFD